MAEPFQDLETELRQLRPRAPSAGLMAGLEQELDQAGPAGDSRRTRSWLPAWPRASRWLVWPVAAALLALGGLVIVYRGPAGAARLPAPAATVAASAEPTPAAFKPVRATKFLYESLAEGPVMLSDGLPVRRVCNRYVDTYTWRNPRTRASVQWIVPREEVRVVPVDVL